MPYTTHTHSHRFAVWAAVRGAQRGVQGFKVEAGRNALACAGFDENADGDVFMDDQLPTAEEFDQWHHRCNLQIIECFQNDQIECSFGRAAKLLNLYLKARFLTPRCGDYVERKNAIHPPIDVGVLNILRAQGQQLPGILWTQMDEAQYALVMAACRTVVEERHVWAIERDWHP